MLAWAGKSIEKSEGLLSSERHEESGLWHIERN
jgi:hypothetical protein